MTTAPLTGRVTEFDEMVGLGVIVAETDTAYPFHCIEIADGTRTIPVGTEVLFVPLAKFGRYEAANVRR